jgi:hypothetical protein
MTSPTTMNCYAAGGGEMSEDLKIYAPSEGPTAMIHIEERMGETDRRGEPPIETTDYQLVFSVGVQHFDVGPRYDNKAEVRWYQCQFAHALDKFVEMRCADEDGKTTLSEVWPSG